LLPLVRQQAREIEQLSRQLASLRDTLEERKTIDKAKSVLMTHQNMSEEQAWMPCAKWRWTRISAWWISPARCSP
jgi:AmiR/NasT family two-component response regulator